MTTDAIQLPEAPGIPGLRLRHFRAGRDFEHTAAILPTSAESGTPVRTRLIEVRSIQEPKLIPRKASSVS